tara:strand:+ start:374 stop:694 length:321 start_codon:yes stop_codon:yes gene_type:complete
MLTERNKFNEDEILANVKHYIDSTYTQHYGQGKVQTTEITFDAGHGEGFCMGNIIKYAQRFGKKDGSNEKDLYKIIHYAIILLGQRQKEREMDMRRFEDEMQEGTE